MDTLASQTGLQTDPVTRFLTGGVPGLLILGVLVASIASIFLLGSYRRAVVRSMRKGVRPATGSRGGRVPPPSAGGTVLRGDGAEAGSPYPPRSAESLYRDAMRAPWRNGAIYGLAGWMFAMVMAFGTLLSADIAVSPLRLLALTIVFAWPVAITLNQVAALSARARLAVVGAYAALFLAVGTIAIALSTALDWPQLLTLWFVSNLPATVLVLGFLNRRVRAVGPIVLIFTLLAVGGAVAALGVVGNDDRLLAQLARLGAYLRLEPGETVTLLLVSGLVFVGAPFGWLTMRLAARSYERKRISDQSLTVDATWLLFGVAQSIGPAFGGPWWILTGVVAFGVFRATNLLLRRAAGGAGDAARAAPRLLLLRVFALGRRSERLFDELALRWRHVGSIQLIAGPDLATTTVEPHEFLDFLSRRLDRTFIDGEPALEQRLSALDVERDQDGRYRVHDFYCYDDTWTLVLRRLVRDSDVILMDLRGFTASNSGCLYEVNELINVAPLARVRILVDDSTDEALLRSSVSNSWANLHPESPNRHASPSDFPILRLRGRSAPEIPTLLREVCGASVGAHAAIEARSPAAPAPPAPG